MYRVAITHIPRLGKSVPIICETSRLRAGDRVRVLLADNGGSHDGTVESTTYHRTNPGHTIIRLKNERSSSLSFSDAYMSDDYLKSDYDIPSTQELHRLLLSEGWIWFQPTSSVWKRIYCLPENGFQAFIAFRLNGIDFKFIQDDLIMLPHTKSNLTLPATMLSRNFYQNTDVDVFDRTIAFSRCVRHQTRSLRRYYMNAGSSGKEVRAADIDDWGAHDVLLRGYRGNTEITYSIRVSVEDHNKIKSLTNARWSFCDVTDTKTSSVVRLLSNGYSYPMLVGYIRRGKRSLTSWWDHEDSYVPSGYLGDGVWNIGGGLKDLGR